jgi:hypothetical protein
MTKMEGIKPILASELRDLPKKRRDEAVLTLVRQVYDRVLLEANDGKISCRINVEEVVSQTPGSYKLTSSEMVSSLKLQFPDSRIEYYSEDLELPKRGTPAKKIEVLLISWS